MSEDSDSTGEDRHLMTNLVTRYCRTFDDMRPNAAGQWVRWDDYETLRKQILACAPFLKEGETPAECIERNRKDTDAVLTLLAQEKRKNETRQDEPEVPLCDHDIEVFTQMDRAWAECRKCGKKWEAR